MSNVHAGVGAGRHRKPWRIKEFLDGMGLKQRDIAYATGKDQSVVSRTIKGVKNDRDVLRYLADLGCPASVLSLPDDLKLEIREAV